MSQVWAYLSVTALLFTGLLLIFIILLQRGRGGGLAGAFGGAGGQSALGTKAGDVFTKITVGLAVFWVFLACLSIYALRASSEGRARFGNAADTITAPEVADDGSDPNPAGSAAGLNTDDAATVPAGEAASGGESTGTATDDGAGPALGTPPAGDAGDDANGNDAPAETNP